MGNFKTEPFAKPKMNIGITFYIDYELRNVLLDRMKKTGKMKISEIVRHYLYKGLICEKEHIPKETKS